MQSFEGVLYPFPSVKQCVFCFCRYNATSFIWLTAFLFFAKPMNNSGLVVAATGAHTIILTSQKDSGVGNFWACLFYLGEILSGGEVA